MKCSVGKVVEDLRLGQETRNMEIFRKPGKCSGARPMTDFILK